MGGLQQEVVGTESAHSLGRCPVYSNHGSS